MDCSPITWRKTVHIEFFLCERLEYCRRRDKAIPYPDQSCTIFVDAVIDSAFGLPHVVTGSKDRRGRSLEVNYIGLSEHAKPNKLHLFTITYELETGANILWRCSVGFQRICFAKACATNDVHVSGQLHSREWEQIILCLHRSFCCMRCVLKCWDVVSSNRAHPSRNWTRIQQDFGAS